MGNELVDRSLLARSPLVLCFPSVGIAFLGFLVWPKSHIS
jgi:hypothetical protein